ncbi:MAG: hypothetical protein QG656_1107, partial [Candidatus Hydrogenedentes bacterium]|nr:hypothetical protein [Candidatus Hydrogenedentota bacterium]
YPEDIKGQMGARPAAEWSGEPISATREGSTVRVTFRLSGAWAQRTAAIPILLREPHGGTFKNQRAECAEGSVTYVFELPEADGASLPWVEIKYPSGEKRMIF